MPHRFRDEYEILFYIFDTRGGYNSHANWLPFEESRFLYHNCLISRDNSLTIFRD